jgi:hypothetical protein
MNALIAVIFVLLGTGMGQDAGVFLWAVLVSVEWLTIVTLVGCSSGRSLPLRPPRPACQHDYPQGHRKGK